MGARTRLLCAASLPLFPPLGLEHGLRKVCAALLCNLHVPCSGLELDLHRVEHQLEASILQQLSFSSMQGMKLMQQACRTKTML